MSQSQRYAIQGWPDRRAYRRPASELHIKPPWMSHCPLSSRRRAAHDDVEAPATSFCPLHIETTSRTSNLFMSSVNRKPSSHKAGLRPRRQTWRMSRARTPHARWTRTDNRPVHLSYTAPEVLSSVAAADAWLVQTHSLIFWQLIPCDVGGLLTDSHQSQAWSIVASGKKRENRRRTLCACWLHRPLDKQARLR